MKTKSPKLLHGSNFLCFSYELFIIWELVRGSVQLLACLSLSFSSFRKDTKAQNDTSQFEANSWLLLFPVAPKPLHIYVDYCAWTADWSSQCTGLSIGRYCAVSVLIQESLLHIASLHPGFGCLKNGCNPIKTFYPLDKVILFLNNRVQMYKWVLVKFWWIGGFFIAGLPQGEVSNNTVASERVVASCYRNWVKLRSPGECDFTFPFHLLIYTGNYNTYSLP